MRAFSALTQLISADARPIAASACSICLSITAIAAELFLGAIRNDLYLRRFIGLPPASGEPEALAIERRVREAARAFAAAYRDRG